MSNTYTYKELKDLWNLPLEDKIARSDQIILRELKTHHNPLVACSWGKDSIVVIHRVLKWCKHTIIAFANTGVEYPETYEYRDQILKEWQIKNYVELKPKKTFWECVKEYGYPQIRRMSEQARKAGATKHRTPKCCYYLKEKPMRNYIKENEIDLDMTGLTASESMNRRLLFLFRGESYYSKTWGCKVCHPIIFWKEEDVLEYIIQNNIPMNEVYKKHHTVSPDYGAVETFRRSH